MINRSERTKLAESLWHLVSGQITNDQFVQSISIKVKDSGYLAVTNQAWMLYSDLKEHKLTGSHAVSKEGRRIIARFIVFLHSDCEYTWPPHHCLGLKWMVAGLISFGRIPRHFDNKWQAEGDYDVWPFRFRNEYEEALKHPKLLIGVA